MSDVVLRLLPGILCVVVGVMATVWVQRRTRAPLWMAALGAATWAGSVALKFAWALSMNAAVQKALLSWFGPRIGGPLFWLYIGLLTGVFEIGATMAIVHVTRLRRADPKDALSFGVGFGAIEAIMLGLAACAAVLLLLFAPHLAGEKVAQAFGGPVSFATVLYPPIERVSAIVVHVIACATIVHGYRVRRPWTWFGVAFVYKSAVDTFAAWGLLSLGLTGVNLSIFELCIAAFAMASAWMLRFVLGARVAARPALAV